MDIREKAYNKVNAKLQNANIRINCSLLAVNFNISSISFIFFV